MSGGNVVMEILDRHVQLAMWAEHSAAVDFWQDYLKIQRDSGKYADFENINPEVTQINPREVAELHGESISQMMGLSETFYVTPDICDVIEEAAPTLPREPLRDHMVPCRTGWIEFGRRIVIDVDEHDEPWGPVGVSWRLEDPQNPGDYPMSGGIRWKDADENLHISKGLTVVWWMSTIDGYLDSELSRKDQPWALPVQVTGWAFDIPWDEENRDKTYTLDDRGERQRKILMTTFNLLMDEIVQMKKERAPRGAARRAMKALHTPDYGDVNVVDLRKVRVVGYERPETDEDAEGPNWSHRWIVRGHWRTIKRGTPKERHLWVRKHVKGPADRPLIVKDRLHLLKR